MDEKSMSELRERNSEVRGSLSELVHSSLAGLILRPRQEFRSEQRPISNSEI